MRSEEMRGSGQGRAGRVGWGGGDWAGEVIICVCF